MRRGQSSRLPLAVVLAAAAVPVVEPGSRAVLASDGVRGAVVGVLIGLSLIGLWRLRRARG